VKQELLKCCCCVVLVVWGVGWHRATMYQIDPKSRFEGPAVAQLCGRLCCQWGGRSWWPASFYTHGELLCFGWKYCLSSHGGTLVPGCPLQCRLLLFMESCMVPVLVSYHWWYGNGVQFWPWWPLELSSSHSFSKLYYGAKKRSHPKQIVCLTNGSCQGHNPCLVVHSPGSSTWAVMLEVLRSTGIRMSVLCGCPST